MHPELPPEQKKRIFVALIGAAVALVFLAVFFLWPILKGIYQARQNGNHGSITPLLVFAGFVVVMAVLMVFTVVSGFRKSLKSPIAPPPVREDELWLKRADWATGKIKSSAAAPVKFFLLWSFLALALSAPAVWHLPQEWRKGNHAILIALLFPVVALYLLGYSFGQWRSRRRFGDCFFELAQIPVPLGGTLAGMIQTGARLKMEHGLHLKLSCIRRVVTGAGKNQSTQESVLWQDEKVFKADANLPDSGSGHSGIPVFFKLPANQPECFARGNESVFWRLEAKSKMRGPDFSVAFDVPVFQVVGAAAAEAKEADPTIALQESIDEIRRDENSRIKISDGPNGREFYFPAARNLGTVFGITLFFLVWTGITLAAYLLFKSLFFEIIFTAVDVLIFFGCLNLWLKSSRVTINSTAVTAVSRWLIFSRTRQFDAGNIVRFGSKAGMQSGSQIFQSLILITVDSAGRFVANKNKFQSTKQPSPMDFGANSPSGATLASGIASKPEADWLVAEMTKALGRRA